MENNIVSWITGRSDLKLVPIVELKEIVRQYPYFTLAQLLLTVKMKREQDPEYPKQLQKTALNFQNPQWLHFQLESLDLELDNKEKANDSSEKEHIAPIAAEPILHKDEEVVNNEENDPKNVGDFVTENESNIDTNEEDSILKEEEIVFEKEPQPIAALLQESNILENLSEENNETSSPIEEPEAIIHENQEQEERPENDGNFEEVSETILEEPNIDSAMNDSDNIQYTEENETQHVEEIFQENDNAEETKDENQEQKSSFSEDEASTILSETALDETQPETESHISDEVVDTEKEITTPINETENIAEISEESAVENIEDNDAPSRLSSMLEAQANAFRSDDAPKEELSFGPKLLPTKDYFASIGITTDNTLNTDFGQKVKRFSDWLKQMKGVGPSNINAQTDPNEEKIINQKADDSNKSSGVLTETMVDILVQQGKKAEAIETLEKLKLLKPEKSSYFASLINNLKNNI